MRSCFRHEYRVRSVLREIKLQKREQNTRGILLSLFLKDLSDIRWTQDYAL